VFTTFNRQRIWLSTCTPHTAKVLSLAFPVLITACAIDLARLPTENFEISSSAALDSITQPRFSRHGDSTGLVNGLSDQIIDLKTDPETARRECLQSIFSIVLTPG